MSLKLLSSICIHFDPTVDETVLTLIDTAHVYYPHLSAKILEVREHSERAFHFAFLQARDPVTVYSAPTAHLQPGFNTAGWALVAGGRADARGLRGQDKSVRWVR